MRWQRVLRRQRAGVVAIGDGRMRGLITAAFDDSLPGAHDPFERDETGRVTRLRFYEGGRELVALRT